MLRAGSHYPTSPSTVTAYKVPSFSVVDGQIAIPNYAIFIVQAAEIRGEPVPAMLVNSGESLRAVHHLMRG